MTMAGDISTVASDSPTSGGRTFEFDDSPKGSPENGDLRAQTDTSEQSLLKNRGSTKILDESLLKCYRVADIYGHNKEDDCWVIINNKVYDVTKFAEKHPGGRDLMLKCGGSDVTEMFHQYHPKAVRTWMHTFCVGKVVDYHPSELVRAIGALGDKLEADGFFVPDVSFTAKTLLWCLSLLTTGIGLILLGRLINSRLLQLCSALFIAGHLQQVAFLGHDTGHCAVTGVRWVDGLFGLLVGNFLSGLSIGWWKDSHNTHHILTNVVTHDPDIQHLPFLAVSDKFFKSLWSFYHKRRMSFSSTAQSFVSYQHWLYYPVMCLARYNLYFQSLLLILFKPRVEYRIVEAIGTVVYWTWLSYLLSFCLSVPTGLAVFFISHALAGILHVQIVLSHFSCETLDGVPYKDDDCQWLNVQLGTSLDVDCPTWMDWFHGGLQFQVAHHLFPRMPRHHLRTANQHLIQFLRRHNLEHHHDTFFGCNVRMIRNLRKVALQAREGKVTYKGTSGAR